MTAQGSAFTWTRRVVVSSVVVVLSLAGHAAGSNTLPSAAGLGLALAIAFAFTASVRSGLSPIRLLAVLVAAQALLHVLFVLSSNCVPGSMILIPSTTTVAGHLLASVVAVLVLRHGDLVLSSWTALLSAVFAAPALTLPGIPSTSVLPTPVWDARAHGADTHLRSRVRRGPPTP